MHGFAQYHLQHEPRKFDTNLYGKLCGILNAVVSKYKAHVLVRVVTLNSHVMSFLDIQYIAMCKREIG